jgi:hypothetical protein
MPGHLPSAITSNIIPAKPVPVIKINVSSNHTLPKIAPIGSNSTLRGLTVVAVTVSGI